MQVQEREREEIDRCELTLLYNTFLIFGDGVNNN